MIRFLAILLALLFTIGCRTGPKDDTVNDESEGQAGLPADDHDSTEADDSTDDESDLSEPSAATAPLPIEAEEQAIEAEARVEEASQDEEYTHTPSAARDLARELTVALGDLGDCMQDDAIVRSHIEVSVTALVLSSGSVAQPSVAGRGLSQAERQCIAGRIRAVALEPFDDQTSSQRVTSNIVVDLSAPEPSISGTQVGPEDPVLRNVRDPLPKRPEVAPSGRPIQEPTSRPIQEPTSRPIQEPRSRKVRGPQPRPIDGWDVDQSSQEWR